jgi:hypothetical protein
MTRVRFAVRLLRWAGAAVLGLAVLVMLALWRLSMGPVDLDFARAYTSRSFDTPEGPMSLEARRVSLVWGGWQEPVQLVLSDIAATDRSGTRVATVPAVVINLSLRSLAGGALQPTEIDIDNVRLDVVITREGLLETFLPQEEGSASRMLPVLLEQLLNEPDRNHPLGLLSQVRIHSARVRIEDRATGFVWDAPSARATMVRDMAGVRIQGALTVQAGGHSTDFQLSAFYGRSREQLDINLRGKNLRPSAFAAAAPQLAPLAEIDLPMDGAIRLTASGNGAIRQVSLELHGGAGRIGVPGVLSPARAVDRAALRLSFAPAESRVRVEEFSVDFQGPQANLTGILELRDRNFRFEGNARIKDVPIARLAEFWLEPLAPGGRRWTLANISNGSLTSAALDFAVVGDFDHADNLKVERSQADMRYDGLTVRYLDPLPPLKGVSGTAAFDGKIMRFNVASGQADALALDGARVDILGLEGPDNHRADMEVRIRAAAPDAMAFLAHPKIGLRKDLLFTPKRVAGDAVIALRLKLPLNRDVAMSEVAYSAVADIERFALQNAVAGLNLTDAAARLEVDGEELKVSGRGKVEGQTLEIQWRELFGQKVPFRRRYEVKGAVSQATLAKAGLSALSDYASGTILFAPLVYQVPAAGPAELTVKANLKEARLSVPELKWEKAAGSDGQATVSARFGAGPVPRITEFDVRAGDLAAAGRLELQPSDGSLQRMSLTRFRLGPTDIAGEIRNTGNGYAIGVRGAVLDVARFLGDEKPGPNEPVAPAPPQGGPILSITVDVGQLLFKRGGWSAVKGSLTRQGDRVLAADLQFTGATAGPSRLIVRPQEGGRQVVLQSPDTGGLLQAAGWLDGLVGGELDVVMQLDDTRAGSPLTARVELRRFRLATVPPVPGRDVGNLNAVVEQIARAGNAGQVFDKLEARIDKAGNTLIIRNARASGDSVGITARGTYRLDTEEICLGGAVTPAYVLNAFLSNIPIIGWILTGGEGRGLFAINYSVRGPIGNPKGDVDAATAITPGFLRRMMEGSCGIYEEPREGSRTPHRSLEEQQQDRIGH